MLSRATTNCTYASLIIPSVVLDHLDHILILPLLFVTLIAFYHWIGRPEGNVTVGLSVRS